MILVFLLLTGMVGLASSPQVIVHGMSAGDIGNLDPVLPNVSVEYPIIRTVHEGLVDLPEGIISSDVRPALAESWDVSEDQTVYTFYLRKDVSFHGGFGPFTAEDVKFSLDRYCSEESAWHIRYENVNKIEILDKYTVRVKLNSPDIFFLMSLATGYDKGGVMISKKAFEEMGKDVMRRHPIGTGPFAFESYQPGESITLVRNDDYWGGKPNLEKIVYRFIPSSATREMALMTGEIDTMRAPYDADMLDRLKKNGFLIDVVGPDIAWILYLDTAKTPLDDIKVRKAVACAVDKKEYVHLLGEITSFEPTALYPPSFFSSADHKEIPNIDDYIYDPQKAEKLLSEAGYPDGFEIDAFISERSDYQGLMIVLQEQLRRIGIKINLEVMDHTTFHSQNLKGLNSLIVYGHGAFPDSFILLTEGFHSDAIVGTPTGYRNFARYNNPKFDDLIEKARSTTNLEERDRYLVEAQKLVMAEVIAIPLVSTKQPLVRSPKVSLGYDLKDSLWLNYRFDANTKINN